MSTNLKTFFKNESDVGLPYEKEWKQIPYYLIYVNHIGLGSILHELPSSCYIKFCFYWNFIHEGMISTYIMLTNNTFCLYGQKLLLGKLIINWTVIMH